METVSVLICLVVLSGALFIIIKKAFLDNDGFPWS